MTSIELTTSELHDLLNPVLPHACTDKDMPELGVVRLEVRDRVLYAVASDRYTMAVTRHRLQDDADDTKIAISRVDATAMLKLFKYDRTSNPDLELTVGKVEAETILDPSDRPALTVSAVDGNTLVLYGREDRPLTSWRKYLGKAIHRATETGPTNMLLNPNYLPRWAKAVRDGSPLKMSFGAKATDPVVIRAGDYFIGMWMPVRFDRDQAADSPWCKEVPPVVDEPAEATPEAAVEETAA